LLHDREFACVTEDVVKEALTKNVSVPFEIFSEEESKHPPAIADGFSLQSLSTERLMPA
jgi:hypothetical protein